MHGMTPEEKRAHRLRAENDMRTLERANDIKTDPLRVKGVKRVASRLIKEENAGKSRAGDVDHNLT